MSRILVYCLFAYLSLLLPSCDSPWERKTINGETYRYRELVKRVEDLRTEVIGTKWIETEHCVIQYSARYAQLFDSIVSVPENAYVRVAQRLKYVNTMPKIRVFYLDPIEYARLPSSRTGGCTLGCFTDTQTVLISIGRFPLANDSATLVTNHEMAHVMAAVLYGHWRQPELRDDGAVRFSIQNAYEEALCQQLEPRAGLGEDLLRLTPEEGYLTFADMDTLSIDGPCNLAVVELRALIQLIIDQWDWATVLQVLEDRYARSFTECLASATGMARGEIEKLWFAHMDSLRNGPGPINNGGAQQNEPDISQDRLSHDTCDRRTDSSVQTVQSCPDGD